VSAGTHTFKWLYNKDYSVNAGEDCAWVDYIVLPPVDNGLPQMYMSQGSFEHTMYPEQTMTDTLIIANIGGGTLEFLIEIMEENKDVSWLSANPTSGSLNGGEQAEIELLFNTESLDDGTYTCTILVTDNLIGETEIPVTLTVDQGVGISEVVDPNNAVSVFPNPFTHKTTIHFNVATKTDVSLEIFNSKGDKIKILLNNSSRVAGKYSIRWDGTGNNGALVPGGIYLYKLSADKEYTGRIVLTR